MNKQTQRIRFINCAMVADLFRKQYHCWIRNSVFSMCPKGRWNPFFVSFDSRFSSTLTCTQIEYPKGKWKDTRLLTGDGVSNLSLFSKHAERSLFLLCMEQMVSHPIVCDELPPIPSPLLPFSKDSSTPHEASTSRRCFLPSRRPVVVVSEGSREEEAVIRTSMVARLCGSFMCRKW